MRAAIENTIEVLIALLDAMDGDPDLELCCEDEGVDTDSEPDP